MTTNPIDIRFVFSPGDVREAEDFLMSSILIANDIETIPQQRLITVNGYCGLHENGVIRSYVFPFYNDHSPASGVPNHFQKSFDAMRRINASGIPFTFHNGFYDLYYETVYGMPVSNYYFDTMTGFWSLYPELPKTLDFVSSILLDDYQYWKGGRKADSWVEYLEYNGKDIDRTLRNTVALVKRLISNERARRNFADAHLRVLTCLGMSLRGMRADEDRLAEHGQDLAKDAEAALERLRFLIADPDFNPNSPKQKNELLYKTLGIRMRNAKGRFVSKFEDASSGAVAMRAMRSEHPLFRIVVNAIMSSMEPAKQISNVIGIKRAPWGRFYTAYNGVGTTTSRLSASETPLKLGTNAQNIRAKYRDWITADYEEDEVLLDIDLSAGDDVMVTFESADPKKIELFRSGKDTHCVNATLFFPNWTYESVLAGKKANDDRVVHPITGIRQITKKMSHGCNYLMAALTLLMNAGREAIVAAAKELGHEDAGAWTQEKLAEFCVSEEMRYRTHYTRFMRSGPESWYTDLRREVLDTGGFTTPFHYYQRFLGDARDDNVLRAVAATAGQAGTAGRINMAMEELTFGIIRPTFRDSENPSYGDEPALVNQRDFGVSLRLQTHDSLTFKLKLTHPNIAEGVNRIFRAMNRPVVIRNKLTGELETFTVGTEASVGFRWGKKMEEVKGHSYEALKLALQ